MTRQFHERYISRAEHNSIVAYYKKLIIQLHQSRQAARDGHQVSDLQTSAPLDESGMASACWAELGEDDFTGSGGNVVKLDFTRRRP